MERGRGAQGRVSDPMTKAAVPSDNKFGSVLSLESSYHFSLAFMFKSTQNISLREFSYVLFVNGI